MRGTNTHRGCRAVAQVKSGAGIYASKRLTVSPRRCQRLASSSTLCVFSFQWMTPCYLSPVEILLCAPIEAKRQREREIERERGERDRERMNSPKEALNK